MRRDKRVYLITETTIDGVVTQLVCGSSRRVEWHYSGVMDEFDCLVITSHGLLSGLTMCGTFPVTGTTVKVEPMVIQ